MVSRLLLLFHTVRYLRPIQILSRIKFKLYRPWVDVNISPNIRVVNGCWSSPIQHKRSLLSLWKFHFLNEEHSIKSSDDWDNPQLSKLWRYNLHYFDDLNSLGANSRVDWHKKLLIKWVHDNPPALGSGWEPYPTSLRIVNWIKWGLSGNELTKECILSLAIQIRWLSKRLEFHILGNHLFANAKALIFAGLYFEGKEANDWYLKGIKIIEKELPEQVLADGGNFELSTMYHAIFLEDLLDIFNLHRTFRKTIPCNIEKVIQKMMFWLNAMCHPDGEISLFNDSAIGVTPSISNLYTYAKNLDFILNQQLEPFLDFPNSGYSRVEVNNMVAFIDRAAIGPDYLPGHAHADTLSFELSIFGQRVIVNSGTSVYGSGLNRQQERSTAAHSTIEIDGQDSSEVWDGFRAARRARINNRFEEQFDGVIRLTACHSGYKRLPGKPEHCREWEFGKDNLIINDKIIGKGIHQVKSVLPLHPNVRVISVEGNQAMLSVMENKIEITVEGDGELAVINSNYHPDFGYSLVNSHLVFCSSTRLPIEITTRISW